MASKQQMKSQKYMQNTWTGEASIVHIRWEIQAAIKVMWWRSMQQPWHHANRTKACTETKAINNVDSLTCHEEIQYITHVMDQNQCEYMPQLHVHYVPPGT